MRAEKLLTFKNVEYKARMSLDTIIRIEDKLGIGLFKLATNLTQGDFTTNQIISILTLAIRAGGNDVKDNDVKVLVEEIGLIEGIRITGELITLALNVDNDNDEKKSEEVV
tara:strand:+ start:244 stop:576 length:333 start_codon:yes stop_codon:yes gene_type:complete